MSSATHKDDLERSLLLSLLGHTSVLLSGAVVTIVLARHYGRELFGQWAAAMVFAQLTGTVVEGGLGRLLMREAARAPDRAGRSLRLALRGRVLLGVIVLPTALLGAWLFFGGFSLPWFLALLLVTGRFLEGLQATYQSVLFALGAFRLPNLIQVAQRLGRVALVVAVVLAGGDLWWAALATLAVACFSLVASDRLTRPIVRPEGNEDLRGYWREATWFWIGGVLFWVNAEIDQLMLSRMVGDAATGTYAAAIRLIGILLVIPRLVSDSVVPRLFRSAPKSVGTGNRDMNMSAFVLSALGGVAAANIFEFGSELTLLVYSAEYAESGAVLAILGTFVLFNFARTASSWFLSTSDRVRTNAVLLGLAAIANVFANLYFIPRLGASGAAMATVLSEGLLLLLATAWAWRITSRSILWAIVLGLAPGLCVGSVLWVARGHVGRYTLLGGSAVLSSIIVWGLLQGLRKGWTPFGRG
jgi:O-antigen/teichoic acid export membrane protein